jgi:2-polyprenyl-3-methyl-5-hydroxy-6-metoxy-1,4-benzoquinol methylase
MKELASKNYWDSVYKNMTKGSYADFIPKNFKSKLKHLTRDYSNFLIWEVILPKFLPASDKLKLIEVGCAPGKYLINFHQLFGYQVYGVEYSENGASITKANFKKYDLNPEQIVQANFFDPKFQNQYREKFDLVFSRGFIEHFDDVQQIVDHHLNLLKKGGHLIVMIPNLSGLNYFLARIFNNDSLILHNLSIMNKNKFSRLFDKTVIGPRYSDYVGLFSFGLFNTNSKLKYSLHRFLTILQWPLDFLLRSVFGSKILKSRFSSPYLLFIGVKE